MWRKGKKKGRRPVNMLDLAPVRLLEHETGVDGRIVLLKPRFTNPLLARYLLPRLSCPNFRITLDEFGSHVWNRLDGSATVRDIGVSLRASFGEEVEPVYQRLGLFCRQLAANRFIEFAGAEEPGGSPAE